jgi:hypothetical protein
MTNLRDFRTWVLTRFGDKAVDFWDGIATEEGTVASQYYFDNVHVNNAGHEEFYNRLKRECILDSLAKRYLGILTVNAGNDVTLNLPTTSCHLQAVATSTNATISSVTWNQITGPTSYLFSNASSLSNQVTNLIKGTYQFELLVSDSKNNIARDTISILVACDTSSITYSTSNVSVCSYDFPYNWNGTNYDSVGTYYKTLTNSLGCDSIATLHISLASCQAFTFTVKAILEGYYNSSTSQMNSVLYNLNQTTDSSIVDYISIDIWHPDDLVESIPTFSIKTLINKNGFATVSLPSNLSGGHFYISIKHKNSLETWSANTVRLLSGTTYDFSSNLSRAYSNGNNVPMKYVSSGKYALFSGDVNQDGTINSTDLQQVENNSKGLQYGYFKNDLNGDGVIDIYDMQITDNNKILFLNKARP